MSRRWGGACGVTSPRRASAPPPAAPPLAPESYITSTASGQSRRVGLSESTRSCSGLRQCLGRATPIWGTRKKIDVVVTIDSETPRILKVTSLDRNLQQNHYSTESARQKTHSTDLRRRWPVLRPPPPAVSNSHAPVFKTYREPRVLAAPGPAPRARSSDENVLVVNDFAKLSPYL
ncbi:hypothetical protein EVAR_38415_1 [Eumeta japonica]|uniref:Uncharacterized protein n=1 Tax=Eumeta variegata TaxID=151549 RepID=A0A4C1WWK5_EUMVA|nr:hypothetical protein EVAR_38415_1 [Eumeta japonica]